MENLKDKIVNVERVTQGRIIAISDIHGNLTLLKKLLKKVNLKDNDYLIILGDFLQRGYENTETFEYIKELTTRPYTYVLSGNHEHYLCSLLERQYLDRLEYHMNHIHYGCIIREWIQTPLENLESLQDHVLHHFDEEVTFLKNLKYSVIIDDYIFVHGGMKETINDSSRWDLLSTPEFYFKGHEEDKKVIVGHWPVQNYKSKSLHGGPILDDKKKIYAIDGGLGVKDTGQLNAIILGDETSVESVHNFCLVKTHKASKDFEHEVVKLDYLDKDFKVIEKRNEISLCEKTSTGEKLYVINEYLDGHFPDYLSSFLSYDMDEELYIIRREKNFALCMKSEDIGWVRNEDIMEMK